MNVDTLYHLGIDQGLIQLWNIPLITVRQSGKKTNHSHKFTEEVINISQSLQDGHGLMLGFSSLPSEKFVNEIPSATFPTQYSSEVLYKCVTG